MNKNITDIQEATAIVLEEAKRINGGWTPDWDDITERKYFVIANDEGEILVDICKHNSQTSTVYFKTREDAEELADGIDIEILIRYLTHNY